MPVRAAGPDAAVDLDAQRERGQGEIKPKAPALSVRERVFLLDPREHPTQAQLKAKEPLGLIIGGFRLRGAQPQPLHRVT